MPPKFSYEDDKGYLFISKTARLRQPACQTACPAGVQISLMNRHAALGKFADAFEVLQAAVAFPQAVCSHCTRPCEKACNRGKLEQAVPVARIACMSAAMQREQGNARPYSSGKSALVLGCGFSGLSTAFFLNRLGHTTTVIHSEKYSNTDHFKLGEAFFAEAKEKLAALGVRFAEHSGEVLEKLMDGSQAIISASSEAVCLLGERVTCESLNDEDSKSIAAASAAARMAAIQADAFLEGYEVERLDLLYLDADGVPQRELLPMNWPDNAKPVTTVRLTELTNLEYFQSKKSGTDTTPLEHLAQEAAACFHCGKCIGCGTCVKICPGDVLKMEQGKPVAAYPDECIHCTACMVDCPAGAVCFRLPLPMTLGADSKYLF
ncbi:4Fe-4S dicluster domain-containing protein [Desulfovibrio sp. OttesenSCG-928-C06]|nr:4Fe-4S dicluster domain-containing protein [Desulfovibrio sp. OttesenSCG-928-C06]